jgi:Protein of unknown function (DUF2634)
MSFSTAPQPLYTTFTMPRIVSATDALLPPVQYLPAPGYDFRTMSWMVDGAGNPIIVDGYTAWEQWCIMTLMTQRYAYRVHRRRHGTELNLVLRMLTRQDTEAMAVHVIRTSLTTDRRTKDVRNFAFDWSVAPDTTLVTCDIIPTIGNPRRIGAVPIRTG